MALKTFLVNLGKEKPPRNCTVTMGGMHGAAGKRHKDEVVRKGGGKKVGGTAAVAADTVGSAITAKRWG
jgi:hypothetical protein